MTPRDYTVMIGDTFYNNYFDFKDFYSNFYSKVKDPQWPECNNLDDFDRLPEVIKRECIEVHQLDKWSPKKTIIHLYYKE